MEEQIIVEAIMDTRGQLDFVWQFFMTVQIAIFAVIFIYDDAVDRLNTFARMLAIGAIALFDWINANALFSIYNLLDALHHQYRMQFGNVSRYHEAFYKQFVLATYDNPLTTLMLTHGLAFGVAAIAIVWKGFVTSRATTTRSAE